MDLTCKQLEEKLEESYRVQHELENMLEEYQVNCKKNEEQIKAQNKKFHDLQKKYSNHDKERKELAEKAKRLETEKTNLSEKWIRLSAKNKQDEKSRQRLKELEKAATTLKSQLPRAGRCPVCTLIPPCKHYQRSEEIPAVKRLRAEEARAKEQRRNSPRVYKRRQQSQQEEEPLSDAQARIMKKFVRAMT